MSRWQTTLIALLACCLLLTACTTNNTTPAATSVSDLDAATDGQVLTVVNKETSKDILTTADPNQKKFQIQTRLTDFHLINRITGIAWGITRGELRMYMTVDQGQTWTNISPAAAVQFPTSLNYGKDLVFLDSQHGWVARKPYGNTEGVLLYTDDGGIHWNLSSMPPVHGDVDIYFQDLQHGWLVSTETEDTGYQLKSFYNTVDGGKTWNTSNEDPLTVRTELGKQQDVPGRIPTAGYFNGMTFVSNNQGFVMLQHPNVSAMYTTSNGGQSWHKDNVTFNKSELMDCDQFSAQSPQFFATEPSTGYMPVKCVKDMRSKFNGLFTSDGGKSFQFSPFALNWKSDENDGIAPVFLNKQEGWSLQNNAIYHTTDQGKTWSELTVSGDKLQTTLQDYPQVVKLEFISQTVGWILVENMVKKSSRLLQTTDGGVTWRLL